MSLGHNELIFILQITFENVCKMSDILSRLLTLYTVFKSPCKAFENWMPIGEICGDFKAFYPCQNKNWVSEISYIYSWSYICLTILWRMKVFNITIIKSIEENLFSRYSMKQYFGNLVCPLCVVLKPDTSQGHNCLHLCSLDNFVMRLDVLMFRNGMYS